jgi:anhydro-N-acetylmuramic acid kinase
MSGTSVDGIDVAVADVSLRKAKLLAYGTVPYAPAVREAILQLSAGRGGVADVCHWNFAIGELFAEAALRIVKRAGIPLKTIDLVGSHGQTICHLPGGRPLCGKRTGRPVTAPLARRIASTLQIGEPAVIAERTGITTVADFRTADVAAGGQGAPLVPLVDHMVFSHRRRGRVMLNLGGIANVTHLPAGGTLNDLLAFDTGPANMVLDRLAWRATGGRLGFDRGGRLAGAGTMHAGLLKELTRHPYLRRRPPKSTGREEFGWDFADELWRRGRAERISPADLLATAAAFTAGSVADACRRFLRPRGGIDEVIVSGGGARNPVLMRMLADALAPATVRTTGDYGIDVDAKEALAFAILADRTIRGLPANVPVATGAARAVVLGKIAHGG